jgi:hypothetical protein
VSTVEKRAAQSLLLRQAILILGMHRSGTSALGGVLHQLGATPPKTLMAGNAANPRGYWESDALMVAHDRLLASAGSRWDDWRPLNPDWMRSSASGDSRRSIRSILHTEYGDASLFFIKDPRICRFVPLYLSVLKDINVKPIAFLPIRNPLEVAYSLKRRDGFAISKTLLLWLRHVLDAERFTRTLPRCLFLHEDFLIDWKRVLHRATALTGIAFPADSQQTGAAVDQFLTSDLHRERVSWQDATQSPDLTSLVRETYAVLRTVATEGDSRDSSRKLDRLRQRFDAGCELFGPAIASEELASQEARAELARHTANAEGLRQASASELAQQAANEEQRLAEARAEFDRDLLRLRAELAAQAVEKQNLAEAAGRVEAETSQLRASLAQETADKQQLIEAQARAVQEIAELRQSIEQLLKEKDLSMNAAAAAIEESRALRETLADHVSRASAESACLRQALDERIKENASLADRASFVAAELQSLGASFELQSKEVTRLAEMAERKEQDAMTLLTALAQHERALEQLDATVAQKEDQIRGQIALRDAILNSTSWRITAPLRRLKALLTR